MASSPPLSRRGKILKNLQRQLETITIANGYSRAVTTVTTNVKNWRDTPEAETPIIYIIDDNTDYQYHAGRLTERKWTISLFGVMKNQTQLDMEEFIADIETCMMRNSTLNFDGAGPIVGYTKITNIVSDSQLFSEIEGSQLFKVTLEILYTACADNVR